ncbi:MAG: chorismate mutase [Planctomycetes bacterium]|nr:chorismate mutase [Planctomycetota bacterium]
MGRLEDLRAEVDEVDARLLSLLERRARLAQAIGALKRDAGAPGPVRVDPAREAEVVARLAARAAPPLDAAAVRRLWTAILGECRRLVVEA